MPKRPEAWDSVQSTPTSLELATMSNLVKTGYDLSQIRQCAIQAGAAPSSAAQVGKNTIRRMANNPLMQRALRKAGVNFDTLAGKISAVETKSKKDPTKTIIKYTLTDVAVPREVRFPLSIAESEVMLVGVLVIIVGEITSGVIFSPFTCMM